MSTTDHDAPGPAAVPPQAGARSPLSRPPGQDPERDGHRTFGQRRRDAETLADTLPPRQREVLVLLLRGDAPKQIAPSLGVSVHTVNEYIKEIHRHFDVSSRAELLALFVPTWY